MRKSLVVFLILLVAFAAIFSSVTFYLLSTRPEQAFMTLGIYSQNGLLGYTPGSSLIVPENQSIEWTLTVGNRMGSAQLAMILVRIGNSTLSSTNLAQPSNCFTSANSTNPATCFPPVMTVQRIIGDGDSVNLDFTWNIRSGSNQTGLNLDVNGVSFNSKPVGATTGEKFRWIFELWTYNPACGDPSPSSSCFNYGYGPETSSVAVWLQVWFKAF